MAMYNSSNGEMTSSMPASPAKTGKQPSGGAQGHYQKTRPGAGPAARGRMCDGLDARTRAAGMLANVSKRSM